MTEFQPHLPNDRWASIKPFVDAVIADSAGLTAYNDRELYAAVTPLANWLVYHVALPLDRDVAFDPHTVDRFCVEGLAHYTKAGRGTIRSRLRRVAEALLPEMDDLARERPMGPSAPVSPYVEEEVTSLWSWANALPGAVGSNAMRLLALGLGGGLFGAEIGRVRNGDIVEQSGVLAIRVGGLRQRLVPVLSDWRAPLQSFRLAPSGGWVFREGRDTNNRNLVTDFVGRHPCPVELHAGRMRTTWIVHHLSIGTPLAVLLAIAGLRKAEGLDRYLRFVSPPTQQEVLGLGKGHQLQSRTTWEASQQPES